MMTKQNRIVLLFLLLLVGTMPVKAIDYLLHIDPNEKGKVQVYKMNGVELSNQESVTAGEKYRVVATCEDANYLFDHIEVAGGRNIVVEDKEKGISTFVVSGSGSVTVKAHFIGQPQTIELKAPGAGEGTYRVVCNGKKIGHKETVPFGSSITIIAEPSFGYSVEMIKVNDKPLLDKENVVIAGNTIVEVVYKKIEEVSVAFEFIPKLTSKYLSIEIEANGEKIASTDKDPLKCKVPFGSDLYIKIVDTWGYKFLFLINGEEKKLFQNKINEYYYTVKAVEDMDINISQYKNKGIISVFAPELTYVYDGSPKRYTGYRLIPEGLENENIKIEYQSTNPKGELTELAPIEVGVYDVYLSREEDAIFKSYKMLSMSKTKLTILKNKTEITQLPVLSGTALSGGEAKVNGKVISGTFNLIESEQVGKLVKVEFAPEDINHYTPAYCWIPANSEVPLFKIEKYFYENGESYRLMNGNYEINDEEMVAEGTMVDVEFTSFPKGKYVKNCLNQISNTSSVVLQLPFKVEENINLAVDYALNELLPEIEITGALNQDFNYTGGGQQFNTGSLGKYQEGTKKVSIKKEAWIVSYANKATGKTVLLPSEVGEYEVSLYCPETLKYKAYRGVGTMRIKPVEPELVDFSKINHSPLALGQSLKYASLKGGKSSVDGVFTWEDGELSAIDGYSYNVQFTPKNKNYSTVTQALIVRTCYVPYIIVEQPINGSLSIVNKTTGTELKSGDWMQAGDELIITAVPNSGYTLQKVTVNDYAIANGSCYIVGDQKIVVSAKFKTAYLVTPAMNTLGTINIVSDDTDALNNMYTYGTELKLTALPTDGVYFQSWWDGNIDNPRTYIVKCDQEISANFRGSPTGIDSAAKAIDIRSSGNNLYIQTDTECKARIIDMQGRMVNQFMVFGTATYEVNQPGVYIVILYKENRPVLTRKIKIGQ